MVHIHTLIPMLLVLALSACGGQETAEAPPIPLSVDCIPENLLEPGNMARIREADLRELQGVQGDLNSFRAHLQQLPRGKVSSVVRAVDYAITCLPAKAPYWDSVYILTHDLLLAAIDGLYDHQGEDPNYDAAIAFLSGPMDQQALALSENLHMAGIQMTFPEAIVNYEEDPEFLKSLFQGRVSDGTWAFLRNENQGPISEDAMMIVSWDNIYWRVMDWEDFLQSYPDHPSRTRAAKRYADYLKVLLTGMDNTRAFDYPDGRLDPELKGVYEKIVQDGRDGPTKDIVSRYYAYLASHGFREPDDLWDHVERLDLKRVWGVDADTE